MRSFPRALCLVAGVVATVAVMANPVVVVAHNPEKFVLLHTAADQHMHVTWPYTLKPSNGQYTETQYEDVSLAPIWTSFDYNQTGSPNLYRAWDTPAAPMTVDPNNFFFLFIGDVGLHYKPEMALGAVLGDGKSSHPFEWYWSIGDWKNDWNIPSIGADVLQYDKPVSPMYYAPIGVFAYMDQDNVLRVRSIRFAKPGLGSPPPTINVIANFQKNESALPGWNGNVSLAVRKESDDGFRDRSHDLDYVLYMAFVSGDTVLVASSRIGLPKAADGTVDPSSQVVVAGTTYQTFNAPNGIRGNAVNLHTAPDGRVLGVFANKNGYLETFRIDVFPQITPTDGSKGTIGSWRVTSEGPLPGAAASLNYSSAPPSVTYLLGDPQNPSQNTMRFALNRLMFLNYSTQPTTLQHGTVEQYGWMQRTTLPVIGGGKDARQVLMGVIDGPPPVPNENIAVRDQSAGSSIKNIAVTKLESSSEKASGATFTTSAGGILKMKVDSGELPSPQGEAEIKAGVGGSTTNDTSSTTLATCTAAADVNSDGLSAGGVAFTMSPQFAGYRYQFLDMNGNAVPGGADRTDVEIVPNGVVSAWTFDYDPNARSGIIPGELMTYVRTQEELSQLQNGAELNFGDGTHWIETSWSPSGGYSQMKNVLTATKTSKRWFVDAQATIGVGEDTPAGGWGVSVGAFLDIDSETSLSSTQETAIEADLDMPPFRPGGDSTPGFYTGYDFYTIPLAPSSDHATELVSLLQAYPTPHNKQLLNALLGGSTTAGPIGEPWRITYAIPDFPGSYTQNPPQQPRGGGLRAAAPGPLTMPRSLAARGIATPAMAASVMRALRSPATQQKAKTALSAQSLTIAGQLAPAERADLEAYMRNLQAASMAAFRQRHPQWQQSALVVRRATATPRALPRVTRMTEPHHTLAADPSLPAPTAAKVVTIEPKKSTK